jgi:hypothetical protein
LRDDLAHVGAAGEAEQAGAVRERVRELVRALDVGVDRDRLAEALAAQAARYLALAPMAS